MSDNIKESDLFEIILKFYPTYHNLDAVNQKIVKDAYKRFFESALAYSFTSLESKIHNQYKDK